MGHLQAYNFFQELVMPVSVPRTCLELIEETSNVEIGNDTWEKFSRNVAGSVYWVQISLLTKTCALECLAWACQHHVQVRSSNHAVYHSDKL